MSLISPPPPHGQDTRGGHHISAAGTPVRKRHNARRKSAGPPPLVGASALHGVSEQKPEATWAQPLGPGRAVLTRGVSRRSGSVACIRADASPTEVLANPCFHRHPLLVKLLYATITSACRAKVRRRRRPPIHRRRARCRGLPSTTCRQLC